VDQVLVVGVGVDGFDVTMVDAVLIIDDFQHRGDRIGGTGCGRQNRVFRGDVVRVDTVNNILQVPFTGCGQNDLGGALGLQVLTAAFFVAPYTGVGHHDGIIDAVFGVVDRGWIRSVDDLDLGAIGGDGIGFFIHLDGAVERTVDGV